MRLVRLTIAILMLVSSTFVHADKAAEIRKLIPQQKGVELLRSYQRLYVLSRTSDDIYYQIRCVNDIINEAHRQGNIHVQTFTLGIR